MVGNNDGSQPQDGVASLPTGTASATFGPNLPTLAMQVNANNVNIHASNLSALERLAQHSPDLALKLVDATTTAERFESRKYITAVVATGVLCITLLSCSTAIILQAGFWAGIAFFLACAAASAIVAAIFTGKAQDLSWTVGFVRGGKEKPDQER